MQFQSRPVANGSGSMSFIGANLCFITECPHARAPHNFIGTPESGVPISASRYRRAFLPTIGDPVRSSRNDNKWFALIARTRCTRDIRAYHSRHLYELGQTGFLRCVDSYRGIATIIAILLTNEQS